METNKLTITEVRLIRNLLAYKTDAQLAEMLEKSLDIIKEAVDNMTNLPKRPGEGSKEVKHKFKASKPKKGRKPATAKPTKRTRQEWQTTRALRKAELLLAKKRQREEKKAEKERKKAEEKEKRKAIITPHAQEMEQRKVRSSRLKRETFKTRPLDLTGKVAVKLNSKTTVYVTPGTDIEELKKKYRIS